MIFYLHFRGCFKHLANTRLFSALALRYSRFFIPGGAFIESSWWRGVTCTDFFPLRVYLDASCLPPRHCSSKAAAEIVKDWPILDPFLHLICGVFCWKQWHYSIFAVLSTIPASKRLYRDLRACLCDKWRILGLKVIA